MVDAQQSESAGGAGSVVVRVLGPVGITAADGGEASLGPRLQRLLAALVLDQGSAVSVDRLLDVVWEGAPPAGASTTLRTYVTRLRRVLGGENGGVVRQGSGYALGLWVVVDAALFEADLQRASDALTAGDLPPADAAVASALSRWNGRPLGDLGEEEWARSEVARLDERLAVAQSTQVEVMLADGRAEEAVQLARRLTHEDPLREPPVALLMRALHAAGEQAQAAAAFTAYRDRLAQETGLDPSPELRDLERSILADDPVLRSQRGRMRGYDLGDRLGEGTYAVVRRAVQPALGREVAVKIIRPALANHPDFVRRFEHEARLVARVEHPNVVPLYDYWREPGAAYLVMRLMSGGSVADAVRDGGPMPVDRVVSVVEDVGGALAEAHRVGVVHRDVRPANLLLDWSDTAFLADFGIALSGSPETVDGVPLLSPDYAAPEVLQGASPGVPADVLGLALTVYQMLTGHRPFVDTVDREAMVRHQLLDPLPAIRTERPDLPAPVDDVIARATAKDPEARHGSAAEFVEEVCAALLPRRAVPRVVGPLPNPYRGLNAFDEADAHRFFGREQLVARLVDEVSERRLVMVVGPSGSGKSSVVRAGLVPALRRGAAPGSGQWLITTMTPGDDPSRSLGAALQRLSVQEQSSWTALLHQEGGLAHAVTHIAPEQGDVLLVIDQFEELFARPEAEQTRVLGEIAAAVSAPGSRLRVVATVRADRYDEPLRHPSIAPFVTAGTVPVAPMEAEELERAIVEPARRLGVEVERSLAADLVAAVTTEPATLPLLQFSLTELFARRRDGVMRLATYEELGGLAGSVASRAEQVLDPAHHRDDASDARVDDHVDDRDERMVAARRLFARMVTPDAGGAASARTARRRDLTVDEQSRDLLDELVEARLLSTDVDPQTREPTVRVAHEALLREWPRLRSWIEEDRTDLRVLADVEDRAATWQDGGREPAELARGPRLGLITDLAERRPDWLNDTERAWVTASTGEATAAAERDRRTTRRLRRLLTAAAALLVLALVGGGLALQARNREAAAALAADVSRLTALSGREIASEPDRAILLALAAHRRAPSNETLTGIHRAIATQPRIVSLYPTVEPASLNASGSVGVVTTEDPSQVQFVDGRDGRPLTDPIVLSGNNSWWEISGDGEVAVVALDESRIAVASRSTEEIVAEIPVAGRVFGLGINHSGDRAVVFAGTDVMVLDPLAGEVVASREVGEDVRADLTVAVSPDGGRVLAQIGSTASVGSVAVFDADTMDAVEEFELDAPSSNVVVLRDDGTVVLGGRDGVVRLIRPRERDDPVELAGHLSPVYVLDTNARGDVVSVSYDGSVRVWPADSETASSEIVWAFPDAVAIDDDGLVTVASTARGGVVLAPELGPVVVGGHDAEGAVVLNAMTPAFAEFVGEEMRIRSFDDAAVTGAINASDVGGDDWLYDMFGSPDGSWGLTLTMAQGSFDTVVLQSMTDPELRHTVPFADLAEAVGASPDSNVSLRVDDRGARLLALVEPGQGPAILSILSLPDLGVVAGPVTQSVDVQNVAILPDRGVLVVGQDARLLDDELNPLSDPIPLPGSFAIYDIRGPMVALGSYDGSALLLDLDPLLVTEWEDVQGGITDISLSPDGSLAAVALLEGGVQLVDTATGDATGVSVRPPSAPSGLPGVRWADDGTSVWYSGGGAPIRIHADPSGWPELACSIVHRELTAEEWARFVDPDSDPEPLC